MKKIVIYGEDGIGKSTTVSNITVSLASMGLTLLQVGCDPKADSTKKFNRGKADSYCSQSTGRNRRC